MNANPNFSQGSPIGAVLQNFVTETQDTGAESVQYLFESFIISGQYKDLTPNDFYVILIDYVALISTLKVLYQEPLAA